jgi:hypothetical protein
MWCIDEQSTVGHLQYQFGIRWNVSGKATSVNMVSGCVQSFYQIVWARDEALEAADIWWDGISGGCGDVGFDTV